MPDRQIIKKSHAEGLIKSAIDETKGRDVEYTTVKKNFKGTTVYIDIPSHIKEWNTKKYGYQLTVQKGTIFVRIIPKTRYSKHLLSNEELERRLLLMKIGDIDMHKLVHFIENPIDVLERQGRIIRLSEEAIKNNIHFVLSHYENPEESETIDFVIDE